MVLVVFTSCGFCGVVRAHYTCGVGVIYYLWVL